jgi:predicted branched-subunit amino acid permease
MPPDPDADPHAHRDADPHARPDADPPARPDSDPDGDAAAGTSRDPARAAVLRQAASIGLATGAYAISFGALAVAAGLTVAQTCALSTLMFTGGSQFAFVGVIGAGGGPAAAVATATLLGARNGFYGLQMATLLRPRGWRRVLTAHVTIDESTAVGTAQASVRPDRPDLTRTGFWATAVAVFTLWNAATLAGAVVGDALGDPRRYGLDAAAAAAFLALLWPRLGDHRTRAVAGAAVVVAAALVPVLPAGAPVLAAAGVALVAGWRGP